MKLVQKRLKSDVIATQFSWNRKPSDTDMARVQKAAKGCRIALEYYVTYILRDTEMDVGVIEEL